MGPLSTFKEQITYYDVYYQWRYSRNILQCSKKSRIKPQRDQWRQLQSRQKLSLFDQLWRKKCFWNNVGAPFQQNVLQPNLNPPPPPKKIMKISKIWFCIGFALKQSVQHNVIASEKTWHVFSFHFLSI